MVCLTRFLQQLERLLAMPMKIPGTSVLPYRRSSNKMRHSVFSVKTMWACDASGNKRALHCGNTLKRNWLKTC
uniref:Uncharacterized protein n=1 Tax=Parascaris univalens TaxID=6257 RepID=A0A915BV26_PARUN